MGTEQKNGRQRKAERKARNQKSTETAQAATTQAEQVKPVAEGKLPKLPKLPSAARTRKPKPQQPCACGCNTPTRSQWAPGHDARARGWAIRIERSIVKMSDIPVNEQAGAKLMLKLRKEGAEGGASGIKLVKGKKAKAEPVVEQAEPVSTEPTNEAVNE